MKISKIICLIIKNHKWEDWSLESDNSCIQHRICKRCGVIETRGEHEWSEWSKWSIGSDNECVRDRSCKRCGVIGKDWSRHSWSDWIVLENCEKHRSCLKCNFTEYNSNHEWCMGFCSYCGQRFSGPCDHPGGGQICDICGEQLDPFMNA